jgi:hypothetical protein
MTNIITQIADARGNRPALLALASSDTLDAVAGAKDVTPIYAAKFVAQRLFDAPAITMEWKGQPGSRTRKQRYDLTNSDQAYRALEIYGWRSEALAHWQATGNMNAFIGSLPENMNGNNVTTELKITRHK